MRCRIRPAVLALLAVALLPMGRAAAIDTHYGEDPVPGAHCVKGSICYGYGVDPIPDRSPLQRFQDWRAIRNKRKYGTAAASEQPQSASPNAVANQPAGARSPWDGPVRLIRLPRP